MAELTEWSAQALRYQGSDGPVKVMYFWSRQEAGTNVSFDQYYAVRLELGAQSISSQFPASVASDSGAFFSGRLFEVLDSRKYKLQREKHFEDRKSAIEDLTPIFNNIPRVAPFDQELSNLMKLGPCSGPRLNDSPIEDVRDGLWYDFPYNGRGIKVEERRQKGQAEENKKLEEEGKKDEEDWGSWFEETEDVAHTDVRMHSICALVFGITTQFNPSGVWIVEDFYGEEEIE